MKQSDAPEGEEVDDEQPSFNAQQLDTAVGRLEQLLAHIEEQTLGKKWNARQRDMLILLGQNGANYRAGFPTSSFTATEFRDRFVEAYGVSDKCIEDDIDDLLEDGMITKTVPEEGDKRKRHVALSVTGQQKWDQFAQQRTAAVLSFSDVIRSEGPAEPTTSQLASKVLEWKDRFLSLSAAALICLAGFGVVVPEQAYAETNLNDFSGPLSEVDLSEADSVGLSKAFALAITGRFNGTELSEDLQAVTVPAFVDIGSSGYDSQWLKGDDPTDTFDVIMAADREGLYDALLPPRPKSDLVSSLSGKMLVKYDSFNSPSFANQITPAGFFTY